MRVGACLFLSMVAALCVAYDGHTKTIVPVDSVATIVMAPRNYVGKTVTVSGVIIPGPALCAPQEPDETRGADYSSAACIAIVDRDQRMFTQEEKYNGARATVTGVYWHRCLSEVREAEPEIIREYCDGLAKNGWLGPNRIDIQGYTTLRSAYEQDGVAKDVTGDPQSRGADDLARRLLAATQTRNADMIAELFRSQDRGRLRVSLKNQTTRDYWVFLSPEMTASPPAGASPGSGYRHYQPAGDGWGWSELCFCRMSKCDGQWPSTRQEFERPQSVRTPYVCHRTVRSRDRWYLE